MGERERKEREQAQAQEKARLERERSRPSSWLEKRAMKKQAEKAEREKREKEIWEQIHGGTQLHCEWCNRNDGNYTRHEKVSGKVYECVVCGQTQTRPDPDPQW